MSTLTDEGEGAPVDSPSPVLSKHAQKKLARQQFKQQMKAEHHARGHTALLAQAERLQAQLQQCNGAFAVPNDALYTQLPRGRI